MSLHPFDWVAVALYLAAMLAIGLLAGAVALLEARGPSLQDISIRLTGLLGGGILGIYCMGFFTARGDARSVWCGIAATLLFTLWTLGWLPIPYAVPFDLYYTAVFGNLAMFVVGYTASLALPRRDAIDPALRIGA